mmetsp:Transcript_4406/g.6809  ORF Transcript_4406/g.6809 Transcript_4406/m.6809 type:complete len:95 (-) Transcript_4406:389-673(-)
MGWAFLSGKLSVMICARSAARVSLENAVMSLEAWARCHGLVQAKQLSSFSHRMDLLPQGPPAAALQIFRSCKVKNSRLFNSAFKDPSGRSPSSK